MLGNILAVGLISLGMGISGVKDEPQNVSSAWKIHITENATEEEKVNFIKALDKVYNTDGNTNPFSYIQIWDKDNGITHNYTTANYDQIGATEIELYFPNGTSEYYWIMNNTTNALTLTQVSEPVYNFDITITSKAVYQEMQNMIATDPEEAGQDIIGSIASGLGLIASLATEFLVGFTNLFYSAGALTPFAIFSLIMLGIAVSFAVVKLVLNLIKSNTGA